MKKIFFISSLALGAVLFFLAVYNFGFRDNAYNPIADPAEKAKQGQEEGEEFPFGDARGEALIQKVSQEKVLVPFIPSGAKNIFSILPESRLITKTSIENQAEETLMELPAEPQAAVWAPDASRVLVELVEPEPRWHLFTLESKTSIPLKPGLEDPLWTNLGDKILYKYYDTGTKERSLNIANPDGSGWKKLADIPFQHLSLVMLPQSSMVAFWNRGNAFEETLLRTMSVVGGEAKTVFVGKYGAEYRFSPDGKKILVSSASERSGSDSTLGLLNNQGGEYKNLLLRTFAEKSVWGKDSRTLYYALPGALPDGAIIPNDYLAQTFTTKDTFWKINTMTGEQSRLVPLEKIGQSYDATNLMLDPEEDWLYFVNRSDGFLYRIKLLVL